MRNVYLSFGALFPGDRGTYVPLPPSCEFNLNFMCKKIFCVFCACLFLCFSCTLDASERGKKKGNPSSKTEEINAAWIATVDNINWPSKPGLSAAEQKREAVQILDQCKAIGINVIVLQVRPAGDAFYPSQYFPWSKYLTGTQGRDPGYDPLAFWLEQTHKRKMALHAWINPYRLSTGGITKPAQLPAEHPARKNPTWAIPFADGKIYFNPGIPACRKYVVQAAMEIVKNYPVDGIHIDDYFYPYPKEGAEFNDQAAFKKFSAKFLREAGLENLDPKQQLQHWRRNNVNTLIKEIYDGKNRIRKSVQFGVSPFGIWRNQSTDPTGSDTKGLQSYDAIYADTKYWIENGIVDYVVPQLYWNIGFEVADYARLVQWWNDLAARHEKVALYIGLAVHRVGGNPDTAWEGSDEIVRQIQMNRTKPAVAGQFYFGWKEIARDKAGVATKIKQLIQNP